MIAGPRQRNRRDRGFTLLELLVSLFGMAIVMASVIVVFQLQSQSARTQTQVAEMQQSLRMAQYEIVHNLRMVGRGGLPASISPNLPTFAGKLLPTGMALEIQDNVPSDTLIGGAGSPAVLPGTDVLTIRGVLTTPMYQVDPTTVAIAAGTGSLTIHTLSPAGVAQNLQPLADAIDRLNEGGGSEALLLVSPLAGDIYAITELSTGQVVEGTDASGQNVVVRVNISFTSAGSHAADYLKLMPGGTVPSNLSSAAFVGMLEEYRYYIREDHAIPTDDESEILPRLSRARFYPGTQLLHPDDPTGADDIVDNAWDLQVAIGVDSNNDGIVTEGADDEAKETDEWLYNGGGDTSDDPAVPATWAWNSTVGAPRRLAFLRVTTLVRSDRRQFDYIASPIQSIEDRHYGDSDAPTGDALYARSFRRQLIQTVIELRNLG
jgi:type II secretory pathway pseudopilin PulG